MIREWKKLDEVMATRLVAAYDTEQTDGPGWIYNFHSQYVSKIGGSGYLADR